MSEPLYVSIFNKAFNKLDDKTRYSFPKLKKRIPEYDIVIGILESIENPIPLLIDRLKNFGGLNVIQITLLYIDLCGYVGPDMSDVKNSYELTKNRILSWYSKPKQYRLFTYDGYPVFTETYGVFLGRCMGNPVYEKTQFYTETGFAVLDNRRVQTAEF